MRRPEIGVSCIGDLMCCGGNNKPMRVQHIAPQTSQRVQLKPPTTMRVYTSEQRAQQPAAVQAVRKVESESCPLCHHPVMVARVSGRPRKQCTNFSCRHIMQ